MLPGEDASSGQRNAVLCDALTEAVAWAKDTREPAVAEGLDFTTPKKAIAQLSLKGARKLSGLLYAKYRQLGGAGGELVRIAAAVMSTIDALKLSIATGLECACFCGRLNRPSRAEAD